MNLFWLALLTAHTFVLVHPYFAIGFALFDLILFATFITVGRNKAYAKYVFMHKLRVYQAGRIVGVNILTLIFHDWDKFLPGNWSAYSKNFYNIDGNKWKTAEGSPYSINFEYEWNAHQKRNKHHWQYWLLTWDHGGTDALVMPDRYVREMIADWMGAGATIKGEKWGDEDPFLETREWYISQRDKMILHPETIEEVEGLLRVPNNG